MSGIGPISAYDLWKLSSPPNDDDWDDDDDDWDDEDDEDD